MSERPVPTLFQLCSWAANDDDSTARDVIQTIIDHTESPRTVDELTRILAEADAP